MRKLTIGISTFDDYNGVYFTLQSIRLYHKEVLDDIEFVILNNNPKSPEGKSIYNLVANWIDQPVIYIEFDSYNSTSLRSKIFDIALTPYVLVIDSHVLLEPGSIKKLIEYYDKGLDRGNLLQGPLVYDDMHSISTHFDFSKWGSYMWGQWATDERGLDANNEPFEIAGNGLGLFSCRKKDWLGFNPNFRGFGGEEGYIHEKYKKNGKQTVCLPFLRWVHRFERPTGTPYVNNLADRFRNYIFGFTELNMDITPILENFKDIIPADYIQEVLKEVNINMS